MHPLRLALLMLAFSVWQSPAVAAGPASPAGHDHSGRVGVLPDSWVATLESNNISEQTALIAGGATVAAVGVGAVAGAAAGGTAGAAVFALWLAHWPIQIALMGSGGYLAWNYLLPAEPTPDGAQPASTSQPTR